jgi:hypothetical protein
VRGTISSSAGWIRSRLELQEASNQGCLVAGIDGNQVQRLAPEFRSAPGADLE